MNTRNRQKGVTAIGWLIILLLIGFFSLVTLKLVPVYITHYGVVQVVEKFSKTPGLNGMSKARMYDKISANLSINSIRGIDTKKIMKIKKSGGVVEFAIDYTPHRPLFGNVGMYIEFKKVITSK